MMKNVDAIRLSFILVERSEKWYIRSYVTWTGVSEVFGDRRDA